MQSHYHHARGADHAEVGGRRRGVFGGHEGKDEGRWALFCDLVGDDDGGDDDGGDDDSGDDDGGDDVDGGVCNSVAHHLLTSLPAWTDG